MSLALRSARRNRFHAPELDGARAEHHRTIAASLCVLLVLAPRPAAAQAARLDALHQLNDAIEELTRRVSPSVVQIVVGGYGSTETGDRRQIGEVIGKVQVIGSGVIVDPDGYIVTNAHVINGAEKIEVIVPAPRAAAAPADTASDSQGTTYTARIIGITQELDLAVIKIDAHALPALPVSGANPAARQGEMVFAFGSPEGLRNTVTMGVVSAVARQPDPDSPRVYVQTDTPINPGNSGGALVDADGHLVGINTFMLSTSGGNQGLGFAIPSGIVAYAYPQLVKYGHVHHPSIGASLQTITPDLAAGLHLARGFGIIVSDVSPRGPADDADLRVQDIILGVDGSPVESLPMFAYALDLHKAGDKLRVDVLRGSSRVSVQIALVDRPGSEVRLSALADPEGNLVKPLGILGITVDFNLARSLPPLRIPMGVVVAARTLGSRTAEIPLQAGDVIHAVNGAVITTLNELRGALSAQKPGDAIVLQIDRDGKLAYVSYSP